VTEPAGALRVLAVIDSTGTGGAEQSLASLAPLLAARDVELEVAYFHDRAGIKDQLVRAGIALHHVRSGRSRVVAVWRLSALVRRRRPDLVHTAVFEADVIGRPAARLAGVPVVSSIIGEMYGPEHAAAVPSRLRLGLARLADIATARLVVRFHAVTRSLADVMAPRLHIDAGRIEIVYRGREPARFAPVSPARRREIRRGLELDAATPLVLAVARHEPIKNLESLIRAVPQIASVFPTAVVMIAGRHGTSTPRLERLVDEYALHGRVVVLGERDDVAELLAAADTLVCASVREGIGGSVLEALASGCPVVCSDLPSLREITRPAPGATHLARFFAATDAGELAAQVAASLTEGRTAHGDAARRAHFDRHFDIDAVADQMVEFYRHALDAAR
jgi:glycosyltransferase involved in cell wall biosynthesis